MDRSSLPFPLNDNVIEAGFCWGEYEVTLDTGPRIRLPRSVVKVLKDHEVCRLWRYPDPTGPRIIICPEQSRLTYMKLAEQHLPASMESGEAYRKYICTGEVVLFRDHGRISITAVCNKHMDVVAGQQVVIVGTGLWYEVWKQDEWLGNSNRGMNK